MNKQYTDYLLSSEWAQLKIDLYNHRGKKCELCGSDKRLQVHHLHYRNIFHEEPEDLMILCKDCHQKQHPHKIKKVKKNKIRIVKAKPKVLILRRYTRKGKDLKVENTGRIKAAKRRNKNVKVVYKNFF